MLRSEEDIDTRRGSGREWTRDTEKKAVRYWNENGSRGEDVVKERKMT